MEVHHMDTSLFTACRYTGKVRVTAATDLEADPPVINNESEFRVCFNCGGITHKTVGDPRKTTYDLTKDNKVNSETVTIPADDLPAQEAFRCSYCGESLPDYNELQTAINDAQALHDGAVEGVASGNYAVGSKATLQTAITAAVTFATTVDKATTVIGEGETIEGLIQENIDTLAAAVATFDAGKVA
jgi:DNA-directed RNA polymerase subunit M/transcription elongation factor TFIIS